jgi:antitoxin (DNA-binding transcriptional repressor) of toxin-antitoxin stability system
MRTISKSKLKANMLEIFRQIEADGETLTVTHHNKPVLRIIPIGDGEGVEAVFGDVMRRVIYHADLDEPTFEEWEQG